MSIGWIICKNGWIFTRMAGLIVISAGLSEKTAGLSWISAGLTPATVEIGLDIPIHLRNKPIVCFRG
jgi:hypothetical protein